MIDSILLSVKKNLGVGASYTAFDDSITTYINGAFAVLNQLGVGPDAGFRITGEDEVWGDFIPDGDLKMDNVKDYVTLSVKLIWDPPPTGFAITALKEQRDEMGWRLKTKCEEERWRAAHPVTS